MVRRWMQAVGRVVFWVYPRGTWQYDILCLLILAFIFLAPRSFFESSPPETEQPDKVQEEELSAERA